MNLEDQLQALIDSSPPHIQRHFACDCAERALKAANLKDERSWVAVEVARRYAEGRAELSELADAKDAARAAVGSAAWNAAWSAAWSAAGSAARSAAWSAARDAARSAWYAAGAAARSAWYAAGSAADASWAAADASWAAAREWQIEHLQSLIAAHNAARSSLLHILQQRAEALRPTFTQYARTLEERAFE